MLGSHDAVDDDIVEGMTYFIVNISHNTIICTVHAGFTI